MSRFEVRVVRCPGCGADCEHSSGNRFRPFCSERCKSGDFGAWADEHYRIVAKPTQQQDGVDEPEARSH